MHPRRVTPTRVYRFYRGGLLIDRLRDEPEADSEFPEDWVGVGDPGAQPRPGRAAGRTRRDSTDGTLLRDAIASDPRGLARAGGRRGTTGVLVKLLDAAERLPVHFHPDAEFASAHLGSPFGKTEAWIVMATREAESEVWIGLREPVSAETYRGWIEAQDREQLLNSLHRVSVSGRRCDLRARRHAACDRCGGVDRRAPGADRFLDRV